MTIQQRKSPLVPTVLGAAAGTGIGYGVGHLMTKPMTHDDIIKDINDTTTFSNRVKEGAPEAATWQEVKNKADEVAKLKGALEEAKLGELKDKGLADDIARTEKEIEDAISQYTKESKKVVNANNRFEIVDFDKIEQSKLPDKNLEKGGKNFKGDDCKKLYNDLVNDYKNKLSLVESEVSSKFGTKRTNTITALTASYNDVVKDLKGVAPEKVTEYFATKEITTGIWPFNTNGPSKQYKKFTDLAEIHYPNVTNLSDDLLATIAEEHKAGETVPKGWQVKDISVKNEKGWTVTKQVRFDTDRADELLKSEKERIINLRKQAADEMFDNAQKYVSLKNQQSNLKATVVSNTEFSIVEATQLYNSTTNKLDIDQIVREGKDYADDIKLLEKNKKATSLPTGLKVTYKSKNPAEALAEAQARNRVYKSYIKQEKALTKEINKVLSDNSIIREYDQKIGEVFENNKAFQKARKRLMTCFPDVYSEKAATTETVAGLSREQAIEKMGDKYTKLNDRLNSLKDKAKTAERKAADPEKIKSAQDAFDAGEKSLKEMAESLGKKMTKGPNKLVAAGIGAAVLGLATLLAVNSKNNKAQA